MQNKCNSILSQDRTQLLDKSEQFECLLTVAFQVFPACHCNCIALGTFENRSHWEQTKVVGWVSFNRRPGENVKMQRRLCLEAKSKLQNFSALDVDSADRPSDTNLIKVGGKCESQTETHHNFPAHLPSLNCPRFDRVHWVQNLGGKAWGDNDSRRDQPHLWCFEQHLNVKQIRAGVGGQLDFCH